VRKTSIDAHDARILRVLQADGRISNSDLAQTVGLSPTATSERVRKLTTEGFVMGFEAVLNPIKLAAGMLVFAEVRLQHSGLRFADEFKAAVMTRAEILECHEITGAFDYLIKARVADMMAYRELVSSVVWSLPAVRDIRTFVVLEEIKSTARIPISFEPVDNVSP
jgi:Lrp/AsnC family leucine-responsive transcriptional regulator